MDGAVCLGDKATRRPSPEPTARLAPANVRSVDTYLDQTQVRDGLDVCSWHIAAFAATQHLRRDWTNNGQTSILVRDGYDVNDPKRTSGLHDSSRAIRLACSVIILNC
jgi:hypothetical protein